MDVLFKSIDVRDLLASRELDDSSPLSAPDLRLLIDRLQVHSLEIKSKVHQYILSHHHDFASLFSQCSDAVSRSDELFEQVSCLTRQVSDRPIDVDIREVFDEIGRKRKEAMEKKELLHFVRTVVELNEHFMRFKVELRAGELVKAAETIRDLKPVLHFQNRVNEVIPDEREPPVYDLLRKEWMECFEEIQDMLLRFMEKAMRFEQERNCLRIIYTLDIDETHRIELQTVLQALDVLGILNYGISKVTDMIIKKVITPMVKIVCPILEEIHQDTGGVSEAILSVVLSSDVTVENLDADSTYSAMIQVIKFFHRSLFFENGHWMRCFGRLTWPRMSDLIISNLLSKVVPDSTSKIADFQRVVKYTSDFEKTLKEMNFISATENSDDRLSNFTENVEMHFASRKKVEILSKARNLLLQSDFMLPQEQARKVVDSKDVESANSSHSVDLLFSSETCTVSNAAGQLMDLVHDTLKDACLLSEKVALEFYHAARDALLLYEIVIPIKLERQLDGINQVAVLIHNDCIYLCQEVLGLAFEYRPDFPSSIKEIVVFADLAPRFQLMAEKILKRQIHVVIGSLNEAIDGADGFQNTHHAKQYESATFSIERVVFTLEKLCMIWGSLMLPWTYKMSMCQVLEAVFSRIAKDILLLDDIAAEETLQLQRLIHLMMENLSSLLVSLDSIDQRKKLQEGKTHTPSIDTNIPSLKKIQKLADLLDMPLKSITAAWESTELVLCGFTLTELEEFIRAIFADSPLRKECLWRIQNSSL